MSNKFNEKSFDQKMNDDGCNSTLAWSPSLKYYINFIIIKQFNRYTYNNTFVLHK